MKQLTLKRKIEFLDYAINHYSNKDSTRSICFLFKDEWLNLRELHYKTVMQAKFPELWAEIEKALEKNHKNSNHYVTIGYADSYFYKGRIQLLKRVRKQL